LVPVLGPVPVRRSVPGVLEWAAVLKPALSEEGRGLAVGIFLALPPLLLPPQAGKTAIDSEMEAYVLT